VIFHYLQQEMVKDQFYGKLFAIQSVELMIFGLNKKCLKEIEKSELKDINWTKCSFFGQIFFAQNLAEMKAKNCVSLLSQKLVTLFFFVREIYKPISILELYQMMILI